MDGDSDGQGRALDIGTLFVPKLIVPKASCAYTLNSLDTLSATRYPKLRLLGFQTGVATHYWPKPILTLLNQNHLRYDSMWVAPTRPEKKFGSGRGDASVRGRSVFHERARPTKLRAVATWI